MESIANGLRWIGAHIINLLFAVIDWFGDNYLLPGNLILELAGTTDTSAPGSLIVSAILSTAAWWLIFLLIRNWVRARKSRF